MKLIKLLFCLIAALTLFHLPSVSFSESEKSKISEAFNDGNLHIYFCGTGIPDPAYQWLRHPSCLAVVYNNELFLIDAGAGTTLRLSEIGLPIKKISRVFQTHLHSDHMAGLASVINESWIFGRNKMFPVYGPYGIKEVLAGIKTAYTPDVWFRAINRRGLLDPNISQAIPQVIDVGVNTHKSVWSHDKLNISAFPVHHEPVFPAFGYMLEFKNCKIFVTGDTYVFKGEGNIFQDADVVISEAMSRPLQKKRIAKAKLVNQYEAEFWYQIVHYHSDSLDLAKTAQASGVKRLYLTHLDPSIGVSKADKEAFTAGMSELYSGPITVADDMDELVISSNGFTECKVTYIPTNK